MKSGISISESLNQAIRDFEDEQGFCRLEFRARSLSTGLVKSWSGGREERMRGSSLS
jgi:hypothetical protein